MTNKLKTDWSFDLPKGATHGQHLAIKNTLETLGYEWCGRLSGKFELDWSFYKSVVRGRTETHFGGSFDESNAICTNHFPSFLDFLAWHFQEEETEEQKEIKDIRQQMDKLSQRMKQLEG